MGLSIDWSSVDRILYDRINFLFQLISWLIDRSSFCFIDLVLPGTFRLVAEQEMRSCGEEPSDCRIEYFNL